MKNVSNLFIFNIETDENSKVLSGNIEMVTSLAKNFDSVSVYSTHVGNYSLPKNVSVREIGGGNFRRRSLAVVRLLSIGLGTLLLKQPPAILFHMNVKFASILAPLFRIRNISTTLWYSHASSSLILRWSNFWITNVITTSSNAYPLKHNRITPIGQAVDTALFPLLLTKTMTFQETISFLHVGRISRVKYIEELIDSLAILNLKKTTLTLIGEANSIDDKAYLIELEDRCKKVGLNLDFLGGIERKNLKKYFYEADMCFTGTRRAIDKSAIEAAYCGTLVVTPNLGLLSLLGLKMLYEKELNTSGPSIGTQVQFLLSQDSQSLYSLILKTRDLAIRNCEMNNKMIIVSNILKNVKSA